MGKSPRLAPLVTLLALSWSPFAQEARADFFTHHWENHHVRADRLKASAEFSYFISDRNFDPSGSLMIPSGLQQYSTMQGDLDLAYGLSSKFTLYGRANWRRSEVLGTTRPGQSFSFGDQTLGLNFLLVEGTKDNGLVSSVSLQAQVDAPAYSNAEADAASTPYLGDQTIDGTLGGFVAIPIGKTVRGQVELVGGLGVTFRSSDYSRALPWSVTARLVPNLTGFAADLGLYGVSSLNSDPRGYNGSFSPSLASAGTGGSLMSGAINPTLMTIHAKAGYQFTDTKVYFSFSHPLIGYNAPSGISFAGGLQMSFGGGGRKVGENGILEPSERANRGFVNYSFEAKVARVNDKLSLVKIDKGSADGVEAGQIFDLFSVKSDGTINEPVARAKVTQLSPNDSGLTIIEYFKEVWIEEGFIAKRPLH